MGRNIENFIIFKTFIYIQKYETAKNHSPLSYFDGNYPHTFVWFGFFRYV